MFNLLCINGCSLPGVEVLQSVKLTFRAAGRKALQHDCASSLTWRIWLIFDDLQNLTRNGSVVFSPRADPRLSESSKNRGPQSSWPTFWAAVPKDKKYSTPCAGSCNGLYHISTTGTIFFSSNHFMFPARNLLPTTACSFHWPKSCMCVPRAPVKSMESTWYTVHCTERVHCTDARKCEEYMASPCICANILLACVASHKKEAKHLKDNAATLWFSMCLQCTAAMVGSRSFYLKVASSNALTNPTQTG